jgi:uncharacterized membrane protein
MKKLFPLFIAILLLIWSWGLWYFYNQPIEHWPVVQNWSNQKIVAAPLTTLIARWTEPFWYFEYTWSTVVWQSPSTSGTTTITYTGIVQSVSGWVYSFNDAWAWFAASIVAWTCTDGMSETVYTWTANVIVLTWVNQWVYKWCAAW